MRLRIFDLQTPLFWFTVFFQRRYGEPYLIASLWKPHSGWWLHVWMWEKIPIEQGEEASERGKKYA